MEVHKEKEKRKAALQAFHSAKEHSHLQKTEFTCVKQ